MRNVLPGRSPGLPSNEGIIFAEMRRKLRLFVKGGIFIFRLGVLSSGILYQITQGYVFLLDAGSLRSRGVNAYSNQRYTRVIICLS